MSNRYSNESLIHYARRAMTLYGKSTNEDRSIPDFRDGFKPVHRRVMQSLREMPEGKQVKTAKVVGHCFVAGTLVITPTSLKPIEDLNVGDLVETDTGTERVEVCFANPLSEVLELEVEDGRVVIATTEQIFYVVEEEGKERGCYLKDLKPGDRIKTREGLAAVVMPVKSYGFHPTFDIRVSNRHRFYANGILCHNCLGTYHPHSGEAIGGAVETLINSPLNPIKGYGNWGTIVDNAAAIRYTECELSKYGRTFFDPAYSAVIPKVPNYDGSTTEFLVIPSLLPNLLLNGSDGVGVGTVSHCPSYTQETLLPLCVKILRGYKPKLKDWMALEFIFKYGGVLVRSLANAEALKHFYMTGEGSIRFKSRLKVDEERGAILWRDFPPGISPKNLDPKKNKEVRGSTLGDKIKAIPGILRVDNVSNKKIGIAYEIIYDKKIISRQAGILRDEIDGKPFRGNTLTPMVKSLSSLLTSSKAFQMNVTRRFIDKEGKLDVEFFPTNVPDLINRWLKWRVGLEVKALNYKIGKQEEAIATTKLLMYAITILEVIFKSLKEEKSAEYIVKHSKMTLEQANQILDRQVRSLSKLSSLTLETRLGKEKEQLAELKELVKQPVKKVASDLEIATKALTTISLRGEIQ
jgi:DNA gyrase subunit A